jgi:transposase
LTYQEGPWNREAIMRAYSQDLRERVLQAYDAGDGGYVTLSRRFRVAESTVYRWVRECRREGKRAPKVYRHGFVSVLDEDDGAVLRQLVEEQPDATLAEYATRFEARTGWAVSLPSVCRALKRWGLRRKKKSVRASEQQRPDVAAKRVAYQASIQAIDPVRLVFLDESGVQTNMTRRYARAPQGQRAIGSAPGHFDHLTVLAAIDQRGPVGSAMTVAGGTTSAVFQTYLNDDLLPDLQHHKPDAVIVLDNLKAHHNRTAKRMVEEAGFSVVYLPPYSPEWSPMEECWSKIKTVLRTAGARTKAALAHAIPVAWERITPEDARGWFEHCGYRAVNPRMASAAAG